MARIIFTVWSSDKFWTLRVKCSLHIIHLSIEHFILFFLGRRKRHFVANHTNQVYGNQKKKCDSKKKERTIIEKRGQFHNEKEHIQVIIKSCMHSLLCSKSPIQFFLRLFSFHIHILVHTKTAAQKWRKSVHIYRLLTAGIHRSWKKIFFFSP